jgi:hypothetical protein
MADWPTLVFNNNENHMGTDITERGQLHTVQIRSFFLVNARCGQALERRLTHIPPDVTH